MPNGHPAGCSSQAAGRLGIGCGVPPRQTQVDNIASSNPRLVKATSQSAELPAPLIWEPKPPILGPFWPVRCRPTRGARRLPKRTAVARRPAVNPVNPGEVARRAGEVAVLSSSPLRKMPIKWKNPLYRNAALWYNSLVNLGSPLLDNTIVVKGGDNGGTNVL